MLPDNVVCLFQGSACGSDNKLFEGSHKGRNQLVTAHTAYTVVTACDNAEQLACSGAVLGHSHSAVSLFLKEIKHVAERIVGLKV